jgi:hypothetical protein
MAPEEAGLLAYDGSPTTKTWIAPTWNDGMEDTLIQTVLAAPWPRPGADGRAPEPVSP